MSPPDIAQANGIPAGYGRSCTKCSQAKCKCILRAEGGACERCHRLGKACEPMITSRKRTTKKSNASRTAQLEEKLDDLVSILRATQQPGAPPPAPTQTSTWQPTSAPALPSRLDSLATAATTSSTQASPYPPHEYCAPQLPTPVRRSESITTGLSDPSPEEAEILLATFRSWLKHFPFMYLPPDVTVEHMKQNRPFLWKCIVNITTKSISLQVDLKEEIRREIAQKIVVDNERNLDILQGLVAYIGWATVNSGPGTKPYLIMYFNAAITILYDLSLTRSPMEEQYFILYFKVWNGRPPPPKLRTTEERRVLLSLWYLTSVFTAFFGKMDSLKWTPHMQESLEVLEHEKETPLDEILVALVKMQTINEEAQKLLIGDVMDPHGRTPSHVFKKGLLLRLNELRDGFSSYVGENYAVKTLTIATEMSTYAVGLFIHGIYGSQRVDDMYHCINAVRQWYEIFLSQAPEDFPGFPFAFFIQLSHAQVTAFRVSTFDEPSWDKQMVRSMVDLLDLMERTIELFDRIRTTVYPLRMKEEDKTLYCKASKMMRGMKQNWEPILLQHLGGLPTPNSQMTANQQPSMSAAQTPMMAQDAMMTDPNMIDFGDLTWMTDVFGSWDA